VPRGARSDSRFDTAVAAVCVLASLLLLILPDEPRDRVAGLLRANLVGPLAMLQERAALAGRALAANDSLRGVSDSVHERSLRLSVVEAENDRLRELLGLGRALQWGYVPAEALRGATVNEEHTLLLSAGERQGVQRLSAVVAGEGLVGMVTQVDPATSVAVIWPNPEFRVSAMSVDGNAYGIVTSHPGEGADRWLLELNGVPFRAALRPGTPIVTSGLGGVYPRGVMVGVVLRSLPSGSTWARSYLLRPAVRPSEIASVMILAPERSREGVESVWMPQAEAMQRRVRAAADSLSAERARAATADSLARAAVADSIARAALADSLSRAAAVPDSVPGAPR
jgi:rod shape-determining protein MreC